MTAVIRRQSMKQRTISEVCRYTCYIRCSWQFTYSIYASKNLSCLENIENDFPFIQVVTPASSENESRTGRQEPAASTISFQQAWQPLIVIGNRKSGNNDGAAILSAFRSQLNPAQVRVHHGNVLNQRECAIRQLTLNYLHNISTIAGY